MGQDVTSAPNAQDIRLMVARILSTDGFKRSKRLCELLTYLVEEDLAGRGDRIKATSVAMDIYKRDDDFDQQSDTIVRVEAGRLRQRLDEYYREHGHSDAIVIDIPKGTYRPQFSLRQANVCGISSDAIRISGPSQALCRLSADGPACVSRWSRWTAPVSTDEF